MLKQKLLTIAAVVAIIACGACFIPPIMDSHPAAPPPLAPQFAGVRSIRVVVTESMNPGHLDVAQLANEVVGQVNRVAGRSGLRAGTSTDGADATLAIAITSETATQIVKQDSTAAGQWHFEFFWDATLTTPDGAIRWQEKDQRAQFLYTFHTAPVGDVWSDPVVHRVTANMLRYQVAPLVFSGAN